jgi:hypothetical protein
MPLLALHHCLQATLIFSTSKWVLPGTMMIRTSVGGASNVSRCKQMFDSPDTTLLQWMFCSRGPLETSYLLHLDTTSTSNQFECCLKRGLWDDGKALLIVGDPYRPGSLVQRPGSRVQRPGLMVQRPGLIVPWDLRDRFEYLFNLSQHAYPLPLHP